MSLDPFDPESEDFPEPMFGRLPVDEVHPVPIYRRRKFIAALAISSLTAAAAYRAYRGDIEWKELAKRGMDFTERAFNRIEEEWADFQDGFSSPPSTPRELKSEADYRDFLAKISLRYITPTEIIRPHRNIRDGVPNELPPKSYWPRIAKTLKVADEIRHKLGKPLYRINSAYRSPAYNAACSGAATRSYHMNNQALDLIFTGGPAAASEVAKKLREDKFFKGGIGTYANFIHIDTRGFNATWEV
ncbi:MAG: D-Ala-D-Ala carboxypeptidase family metallohydrolase [Verrucomicrobiales bacterium]